RMSVEAESAHRQLDVEHPAHAADEQRPPLLVDPAAFDQGAVPLEELGSPCEERREVDAVTLFFALDDEADPAWQLAAGVTQRLDRLDAMEQLPLVVADPARIKASVADTRLVRRRLPQVERRC